MKSKLVLFALIITVNVFSQDQLFKKDNTKLEVKIMEVSPTEIKYKLFNYEDGPTISILKNDVALIIYKNGVHEVIGQPVEQVVVKEYVNTTNNDDLWQRRENARLEELEKKKVKTEELSSTKNFIALNLLEPLNGCIGVTYVRELANNYINVYAPINVGFTTPFANQQMSKLIIKNIYSNISDYTYTRKIIEIGLGVNFQSSGKKSVTHFVGPLVDFGQYIGTYVGNTNTGSVANSFLMNRWSFMINNGFFFKPSKNFNIIINAAIGYRTDTYVANDPAFYNSYGYKPNASFPLNAFKLGLCMGYKF